MECTKSGAATIFISRVNKRYGRKIVLQDFSLNVSDCMIMGLLGESGAGKSTILSMAAGFARPDSGEITVLGERPRSARLVGHIGAYLNGSEIRPGTEGWSIFRIPCRLTKTACCTQSRRFGVGLRWWSALEAVAIRRYLGRDASPARGCTSVSGIAPNYHSGRPHAGAKRKDDSFNTTSHSGSSRCHDGDHNKPAYWNA